MTFFFLLFFVVSLSYLAGNHYFCSVNKLNRQEMYIANPIYDSVFKYLMADERIARTILSALLKKDVVAVETRANEYDNISRDTLSIFRIDFGATIRDNDGTEHLILIELQKTWAQTETLRFRQYLGAQYANKINMRGRGRDSHGLPMVAVYLMGHRVGDIDVPVLYVNRQGFDYTGNIVTHGLPDPFVDSLTHDSIIVQIPLLHGQVNNRLDKVLSVFDQARRDDSDGHTLQFADDYYEDDDDMRPIVRRLLSAASDADMRHSMNVEDEYFSTIEEQDTEIMMQRKTIANQKAAILEQNERLSEQQAQLSEQQAQLSEQQTQISEQQTQISEQQTQISEQQTQLSEQQTQISEQQTKLSEQQAQLSEQQAQLSEQQTQLSAKDAQLQASIRLLLQSGVTPARIAATLHVDESLVSSVMSE